MKKYLLLLISIFLTFQLSAQIYVKQDAMGNNDGTSWENAYTDLQDALANANEDDEIWVASGTYKPGTNSMDHYNLVRGVPLYGGFEGTETAINERNPETNETILSGDVEGDDVEGDFSNFRADNLFNIVFADTNITNSCIIDGFTISGGNAIGNQLNSFGGGVLCLGSPIISNCVFVDNFATNGGCMSVRGYYGSSIKILDCVFSGNSAGLGGAIYCDSLTGGLINNCTFSVNSSLGNASAIYNGNTTDTIMNCTFSQNQAPDGYGTLVDEESDAYYLNIEFMNNASRFAGAYFNSNSSSIFLNANFYGNSARFGGALIISSGTTSFDNCVFEENQADFSGGAGLTAFIGKSVVSNCIIQNNSAGIGGGGWWVQEDSTEADFSGTQFTNNAALGNFGQSSGNAIGILHGGLVSIDSSYFEGNNNGFNDNFGYGGAIKVDGDSLDLCSVEVTRSQFIENQTGESGGAIDINNAIVNIVNCVFAYNETDSGGAVMNRSNYDSGSYLTMTNNTFYQNYGDFGSDIAQNQNTNALASTLIQNNIFVKGEGGSVYASTTASTELMSLGGNISRDMSFGPAATPEDIEGENNIGFVDPDDNDFRLDSGSIAQDIGVNAGAPAIDITGKVRLTANNTIVDAGAYERHPPSKVNNYINNIVLNVSPTLTNEYVSINFDSKIIGDIQVLIFNYNGKPVFLSKDVKRGSTFRSKYNVGGLPSGLYFIKVLNGNRLGCEKFIIAQ